MFISLEGGEGTGKTTHAQLLVSRLRSVGWPVTSVREPGGTPLGDYLRDWLKSEDTALEPEAELLLFGAARAELVRTVIRPALESGSHVVLDRYADSTTVYQGYARKLSMKMVRCVNELATGGLMPDLTVLLDAPLEVTMGRVLQRTRQGQNRFEDEGLEFHRRVRFGFKRLAQRDPLRWAVIDTSASQSRVHENIWGFVTQALTPDSK